MVRRSLPSGNSAASVRAQVRTYLASLPPNTRGAVRKLLEAIRSAAPESTEVFSYGIPGFRLDGKALIWCAGWKEHTSLYPMTATVKRKLAAQLEGYDVEKGTIRFPLTKSPPVTLVKQIVKTRIAEIRNREG